MKEMAYKHPILNLADRDILWAIVTGLVVIPLAVELPARFIGRSYRQVRYGDHRLGDLGRAYAPSPDEGQYKGDFYTQHADCRSNVRTPTTTPATRRQPNPLHKPMNQGSSTRPEPLPRTRGERPPVGNQHLRLVVLHRRLFCRTFRRRKFVEGVGEPTGQLHGPFPRPSLDANASRLKDMAVLRSCGRVARSYVATADDRPACSTTSPTGQDGQPDRSSPDW